jgi:hypothetical protein
LNKEWEKDWGGCIELHSNPRCPEKDEVISENVIFNKCLIFETNEYSWHGFRQINLPEHKQHLSRKCISIYLYTKTRPIKEICAPHGTNYIQYPLDQLKIGQVIDNQIYTYIQNHISSRDTWIEFYQKENQQLRDELQKCASTDIQSTIKTFGSIKIEHITSQLNKNWLGKLCDIFIKTTQPIRLLNLTFYLPQQYLFRNNKNHIYVNDVYMATNTQIIETQTITIKCTVSNMFKLTIKNENLIVISPDEIYGCLLLNISS